MYTYKPGIFYVRYIVYVCLFAAKKKARKRIDWPDIELPIYTRYLYIFKLIITVEFYT